MEPLKRILELVKESNFKEANEICFDALYSKIEDKLNEKTETVREGCGCNNGNEELDPVNKKALKGKHADRKDKDIDNDGDVDSSDKYLHKRRKAVTKAVTEDDEKDFKPHMMYDPKTGKGYKADTYKDHLRMDKMGYTHEKPEVKEGYESKSVPLVRTGQGLQRILIQSVKMVKSNACIKQKIRQSIKNYRERQKVSTPSLTENH